MFGRERPDRAGVWPERFLALIHVDLEELERRRAVALAQCKRDLLAASSFVHDCCFG
jgi:hypothetical protein